MNLIKRIRKSYITKGVAMMLALNIFGEIVWPTAAMALTSGPAQPETMSFEPVETTDMVDLFTGDFTYNIPLMNVPGPNGGYPINLAYHASPSMDEEASWVGLGWNINAGAINRQVRGLPDDFDGDGVKQTTSIRDNWTVGLGVSPCFELGGGDNCAGGREKDISLNLALNFRYNSYRGFGYSLDPSLGISGCNQNYDIGLSIDSEDGIGANARIGLKNVHKDNDYNTTSYFGLGFNSKQGLVVMTSRSAQKKGLIHSQWDDNVVATDKTGTHLPVTHHSFRNYGTVSRSSNLSFSEGSHSLARSLPLNNYRLNVAIKTGIGIQGAFANLTFSGNYDLSRLKDKGKEVTVKAYGYENMSDDPTEKYTQMDFSRKNDGDIRKNSSNLATPQLTNDIYGIQGQGIGGSFRVYRNEIGRIYDPNEVTYTAGGYFNGDVSVHTGWGGGATVGYSEQQAWDNLNNDNIFQFTENKPIWELDITGAYRKNEQTYYKVHGEKATLQLDELDFIGGEAPIKGHIGGSGITGNYGHSLPGTITLDIEPTRTNSDERIARNNLVHKITNQEILDYHIGVSVLDTLYYQNDQMDFLGEFEIFHYTWADDQNNQRHKPYHHLNRETRNNNTIKHHNAGYKVLDESSTYYVYGLPVYNTKQIEKVFSVDATKPVDGVTEYGSPGYDEATKIYENKQSIIPFETEGTGDGEDVVFEHSNTHKYYNKTETPPYAYTYLLTSILGADYVDTDGNGPSDADKGYWVKMDYIKYTDNYKWRAPYAGCMYSQGNPTTLEDDLGSYQYGEKELYYMSRIETATHIAIFELAEDRTDNFESNGEFTNTIDPEKRGVQSGLRLSAIKLYEKRAYLADPTNATPIQTVNFQQTYKLCKKAPNHSDDRGKLTLTGLYFTYEGNTRGAMNPYTFEYFENESEDEEEADAIAALMNPDYGYEKYDRWGNYKGDAISGGDLFTSELNQVLPYVNQYQQGAYDGATFLDETNKAAFKELRDQNVAAWSISKIGLPSGGIINVEYESDDYAYVQDKRATQMTYITKVNDNTTADNLFYNEEVVGGGSENDFSNPTQRRIYFKLEEPILTTLYSPEELSAKIFQDYIREITLDENANRNLYFKTFTKLKGTAWDFVSGYVPLEENEFLTGGGTSAWAYGASGEETVGASSYYTQGYVTIQQARKKGGGAYNDFHPISLAAWQYIRSSASHLLGDMGTFDEDEMVKEGNNKAKAKKVKNFFSFIPELIKMFTGYRKYCFNRMFANEILLEKSMIRLTTPDRIKFGGGSRVKQIALNDNWNSFQADENAESYGVKYDYTTTDPLSGEMYSSGVAQYEPMIGGDEIALRYPKFYPGKLPFHTDNNLFFEHPINESYMPAPIVGYSQVKIASLNSADMIRKKENDELTIDELGRGVSGFSVYEFYTAKDFPILTEQTNLGTENNSMKHWNIPLFIPFIATYSRNKIAASQGYKIELNDMHGKLKSIGTYGVDENYEIINEPIAKTTYKYKTKKIVTDIEILGSNYNVEKEKLDNIVPTLSIDPITHEYIKEDKMVGVEYEFFTDQRHNKNAVLTFGFNANVDQFWTMVGPIPIPSFWATLNSSKSDVRTFVTNKIIYKSGILEEVVNINDRYSSSVKSIMFDGTSGRALLTVSSNQFEEQMYNFSHPAKWEYEGMGHAYKNINMEFYAELAKISARNLFKSQVPSEIIDELVPGDEFIARIRPLGSESTVAYQNFKATFISKNYGSGTENAIIHIVKVDKNPYYAAGIEGYFKVYRSGRRNHYMADVGSITSFTDPTDEENIVTETHAFNPYSGDTELLAEDDLYLEVRKLSARVLSASAVVFKDNWEIESGGTENPYATGQAGIWRAYKNYVYAGERSQSKDLDDRKAPNLKEDGVMSNVPLFNWQVFDYERYQPDWQYAGEVTRLNKFGYETENKDRLGIYSAALYGYKHSFPIGVGANATYQEVGTHDFEMFTGDGSINQGKELEKEGNLLFHTSIDDGGARTIYQSDKYKIVGGEVGAENYVILEKEYHAADWAGVTTIDLEVTTSYNTGRQQSRFLQANIVSATYGTGGGFVTSPYTKVVLSFKHNSITEGESIRYLPTSSYLGGMATIYRSFSVDNIQKSAGGNPTITLSKTDAHTGKQSLKINGGSGAEIGFVHGKLELIPGKRYVMSYWVKRNNSNVRDYDMEGEIKINAIGGGYADLIVFGERKSGRIVNGWQKIEVEFELDPEDFDHPTGIITKFSPGGDELYIDDIRISPKTGGIMTYVYNPKNFRLVATLNANNYATFYYYDEQGNLYLTKQETEEGIITLTSGHTHIKSSLSE